MLRNIEKEFQGVLIKSTFTPTPTFAVLKDEIRGAPLTKSDQSASELHMDIVLAINKIYADAHKELTAAHLKAMDNNERLINIIDANSSGDPRIYKGRSLSLDKVLKFLVEKYGLGGEDLAVELGKLSLEGVKGNKVPDNQNDAHK